MLFLPPKVRRRLEEKGVTWLTPSPSPPSGRKANSTGAAAKMSGLSRGRPPPQRRQVGSLNTTSLHQREEAINPNTGPALKGSGFWKKALSTLKAPREQLVVAVRMGCPHPETNASLCPSLKAEFWTNTPHHQAVCGQETTTTVVTTTIMVIIITHATRSWLLPNRSTNEMITGGYVRSWRYRAMRHSGELSGGRERSCWAILQPTGTAPLWGS